MLHRMESIPHPPRVQLSPAGGAPGDVDSQSPTGGEGPDVFIYVSNCILLTYRSGAVRQSPGALIYLVM